ncbi:hypothetical protein PTSG_03204 [Salpingoeca rosetta]|uniref:Transcription elongation factor S-II n=1 Tax=Salpingoeca rosetta (strain ATCC 50818 / BSB-021) TaxID=946362 RepID=F2U4I6_SALR5|nr:uncharacterized protein PTSG_03204 [Salpingoeca rosetta]EGD82552.1 hypothetical protein PTSG_03204 [Salpingoeca rosetta]|eukprot:XP_004995788.1 hypothetical protein PTSG_03204 [Salpingoeca rosetta]
MEEQAVKFNKRLQELLAQPSLDAASATDVIDQIAKQQFNMAVVKKAMLGKSVSQVMRKGPAPLKQKIKSLLEAWKKAPAAGPSTSAATSTQVRRRSSGSTSSVDVEFSKTGSQKRDGMRSVIIRRIVSLNPGRSQKSVADVACKVEEAIFNKFRNDGDPYKKECRSRANYLKNEILDKLIAGELTPEQFATQAEQKLVSEEDRRETEQHLEQALRDKNPGQKMGNRTNQLKCGKCGKNDVEYYEVQLRAADEPMTVIATCIKCGHRWRQ